MLSVGKAAQGMITNVREQLKVNPRLKEFANLTVDPEWVRKYNIGLENPQDPEAIVLSEEDKAVKPDIESCITICTDESLREMVLPGILAIFTPLGVGLLVGARCLGGLLMGPIASGFLLAVMMNNAGGAWDNSKKWVENENPEIIPGKPVKKGTDHHAAVVTGDTVGDPFKDTSGPALNILI